MARQATRTARLREIESTLLAAPDGLSATELAARLKVDRRTVYRDLDFLQGQGVPLWQQAGRFGVDRTRYLANLRPTWPTCAFRFTRPWPLCWPGCSWRA